MAGNGIGDYFISDVDDEILDDDDELIPSPVVVSTPAAAAPAAQAAAPKQEPAVEPQRVEGAPAVSQVAPATAAELPSSSSAPRPQASARQASREELLAGSLNQLMLDSSEVQASALVSLDGFIMASALPEGMQEDRVGAMSAAILGLGERAAAELGRGHLSQVFIEGAQGYVILMAAGERAVLTVMAERGAKLGLVLYDMKAATARIAEILS